MVKAFSVSSHKTHQFYHYKQTVTVVLSPLCRPEYVNLDSDFTRFVNGFLGYLRDKNIYYCLVVFTFGGHTGGGNPMIEKVLMGR